MPLNGITLGQALTDPINQMITITEYTLYTEYAIERQLGRGRSDSVWSHLSNDPFKHGAIKRRPLYVLF